MLAASRPAFSLTISVLLAAGCGQSKESSDTAVATSPTPESHAIADDQVTFARDIAPILRDNCASCHNPEGIGPFSLLTYAQVKSRSRQIEEVTESGYMPPWKPSSEYGPLLSDARGLSQAEIDLIAAWHDAGAPAGEGSLEVDYTPPTGGWALGEPDLVLETDEAYLLQTEGLDIYRNIVMPHDLTERKYVRAVEFQPRARLAIHHAQIVIDQTRWSRDQDGADPELGFFGMELGNAENPGGNFVGWAPGQVPFEAAPGAPWVLEPGTDIVARLHLAPTGRPESIRPRIGLYFTEEEPTRVTDVIALSNQEIDIPAGESDYRFEESMVIPVPVEVMGIFPHAHYIGKDLEVFANLPGGGKQELLRIPDWDFFWQQTYKFVEPVHLPAGAEIMMRYSYDNSANNIRNPFDPPRRISLGFNSTDEMGEVELSVLLANEDDRRKLLLAQSEYTRRQMGDAEYFFTLAMQNMASNQSDRAEANFRRALQADPEFAEATNNLGVIAERRGDLAGAREAYISALRMEPDNTNALRNLFNLLIAQSQVTPAVALLRGHLANYPDDEEFRVLLADTLMARGEFAEGFDLLREGLMRQPESPLLNFRLGVALGRANQTELAERHLTFATESAPNDLDGRMLRADAHLALALQAMQGGDTESYDRQLAAALEARPDHRDARVTAAGVALHQGDAPSARVHLEVLLGLPPTRAISDGRWINELPFPQGVLEVATLKHDRGDTDGALRLLDESISIAREQGNTDWEQQLQRSRDAFADVLKRTSVVE